MIPLMQPISMPFWLLIGFFIFILTLMGGLVWFIWLYWRNRLQDVIIFIDKNLRWNMVFCKLKNKETYSYLKKTYHLNQEAGILNTRGKAMYIFTQNVPTAMKITKNKTEWLNSESLDGVIKNKIIQQIVKPTDKFMDMLLLFGSIGGILAALSSLIVLAITLGILKPPT